MKTNIARLKIICTLVVLIAFSGCNTEEMQGQPSQISQPPTTSSLLPQSGSNEEVQNPEGIPSDRTGSEDV